MFKNTLLAAAMVAGLGAAGCATAQNASEVAQTAANPIEVVGCPADKLRSAPRDLIADMGPVYTGVLASSVDISGWREQGDFMLRLRTVSVPPRGIVPLHSHEDRPGIVHVVSGELVEYNSYCDVPIVHKAGDTTPAFGEGVMHWWSNPSDQTVIAISTDVVPFEKMDDENM